MYFEVYIEVLNYNQHFLWQHIFNLWFLDTNNKRFQVVALIEIFDNFKANV
jgi:hypothetical protein